MPIKGPPAGGYDKAHPRAAATVTPLKPEAVVGTFAPVPELITEIEKLLAEAKSGKLRAAAWAVVYHADGKPDGEIGSGWARGSYTAYGVSAAIERLNYRWKKNEWES